MAAVIAIVVIVGIIVLIGLVVAEDYPELKANQDFLDLQDDTPSSAPIRTPRIQAAQEEANDCGAYRSSRSDRAPVQRLSRRASCFRASPR
jgi:FtsZ-interacting cell division protein ZipA